MSQACQDLAALYLQWKELSLAEGDAIRNARWPEVDQLQTAKSRLQAGILEASARWESERAATPASDADIRRLLRELIELERQNSGFLADQKRRAEQRRAELDLSRRNLQALKRTYAPARSARWQSLS